MAGDAFAVHIGVHDVAPERERGEDGRLGRGVVPIDVGRRVALGQPQLLRFAQSVVVAVALLLHAGEDVVGRAVHDAHDPDDLLAGQRFAQRPDDGDGAGHRRLVQQVDAGRAATSASSAPATASSALLAVTTGLPLRSAASTSSCAGWSPPMTSTTTSTSARATRAAASVADEFGRDGPGPWVVGMGHRDADELQADAGAGGDVLRAGEEDLGQRPSDVAAAEQGDAHGRRLMGVRQGAVLVGGHLQTVQGTRR